MRHFCKRMILPCCAVIATGLCVTMLKGEFLEKRQKGHDNGETAKATPGTPDAPPMKSPEPGSPEAERMAIFQAKVKAGLVPTVVIGNPPKRGDSNGHRIPAFVPTQIVPQKKISDEMLDFQRKLSVAFEANDPIPLSRTEHFAWLKNYPNVRVFGWYGTVTGAQVQEDSSVVVTIEFHAKTEITGMRAIVPDHVTEKYHVANGALQLIDTDAGIKNPEIQVISTF